MIKGLGNWTHTERLMELASYILKKKKRLLGEGGSQLCMWRNMRSQGVHEIAGNKSKIVKEQPDIPYLHFNNNFKSLSF